MAKNSFKTSFTKSTISKDEQGNFIITEILKDSALSYNLTEILDGLIDVENLSLSVNKDSDLVPIEED